MEDDIGQPEQPKKREKIIVKPRWQKEFDESDYDHFLLTAQRRIDKNTLDITLGNISDRLRGAELGNVLPPEGEATYVARDDFIDVPSARLLAPRINTLRMMVKRYGKKREGEHVLKYRKAEFKSKDTLLKEEEREDEGVVFSTVVKLPDATLSIRMTGNEKFLVEVDFRKVGWEDKYPGYNSGFLPAERLTKEEVDVLARHALEVGFYNIFGDPSKSPYPWEHSPVQPPPSLQ